MARKQIRLWLLLPGLLLVLAGAICLMLCYAGSRFSLFTRAASEQQLTGTPQFLREEHVWIPPTEPETEPETEPVYTCGIDMAHVRSCHQSVSDVVGWVRIQDTVIDYPVVQTTNNEFYTTHAWTGQPSYAGAIFADWRCDLDDTDNALIYGHNMGNGTMLHAIKNYKVEEWGMAHRYIEVASLEHRYLYKVLSVNVISGEAGAAFDYWNYIDLNREEYRTYYENIRSTSLVWYGEDDPPRDSVDRLIALQTCNTGSHDGMRCVVFARCIGDFTDLESYAPAEGYPETQVAVQTAPAWEKRHDTDE